MEEEESMDQFDNSDLSSAEQALLTLEKLSEFKSMYQYHKKEHHTKISDMREDILDDVKGFMITLTEFDTFFKDFENSDKIKEDQFFEIYNYYEQKVFEKASVFDGGSEPTNSEMDVEVDDHEMGQHEEANHYMEEIVIGGDEDSEGETNEKDPEVALQDIIDHIIDTGSIKNMKPDQLAKIIIKIKVKVDQVNDKMHKVEKKMKKYKNKNDVFKNEKEYFHKKVNELRDQNEDLKEAKYKLEGDVEDLMKFEQDFQRMVRQNEEKDSEIMRLEDEVDDFKLKMHSLQKDLRQ